MGSASLTIRSIARSVSSGDSAHQSGRITWMAAGSQAAAVRIRRSDVCPLMWLAPSWNAFPAGAARLSRRCG